MVLVIIQVQITKKSFVFSCTLTLNECSLGRVLLKEKLPEYEPTGEPKFFLQFSSVMWHMAHEQCHKEADNYIIYLTQTVLNIKNCNVFLKWDFAGIVLLHKQDLEIMSNRDAD